MTLVDKLYSLGVGLGKRSDFFTLAIMSTGAGGSGTMFVKEAIKYFSEVNAITEKVYSMAENVTPEITAEANLLIDQVSINPMASYAIATGYLVAFATTYAVKLGNKNNED